MKILFIGDVVGRLGRKIVLKLVPKMRQEFGVDFTIANVENAAHGSGVTDNVLKELESAQIDFYTTGDHALKNKKQFDVFEKHPIIRPANFPPGVPGNGFDIVRVGSKNILVINLIGRVFMKQDYDCPFRKLDEILANKDLQQNKIFAIIVDIHAETTAEKVCLKHYVDGRVSALLGTHTHIPTADAAVTSKKTAYITDAGMSGFSDGSLGLEKDDLIESFLTQIRYPHTLPEKGNAVLNAVLVTLNDKTGKAVSIKQITRKARFN